MASQVSEFEARYTPEIARAITDCRRKMTALVPRGYELVYDNYNALVFGYAPNLKTSEAILSIAAYPRWVTLFFLHGAGLNDSESLLVGAGKQVRGIRLKSPDDLDKTSIKKLILQALSPHSVAFESAPAITTVVKSISSKQRSRRPAESVSAKSQKPAKVSTVK